MLSIVTAASAENASELIGSITHYVEKIQGMPASINDALCDGDRETYQARMSELAGLITSANHAMADAGLRNTLNLWAVYGAITANPNCGVHDAALSKADWSREELDRIGYKNGLFDAIEGKICPLIGDVVTVINCRYDDGDVVKTGTCKILITDCIFDDALGFPTMTWGRLLEFTPNP